MEKIIPNLVVAVAAQPKTGKTHFGLTFPEPIVVYSFDIGIEPVLARFKDKKIEVRTYPIPIIDTLHPKPYAREIVSAFRKDFQSDSSSGYKTLMIDTWTLLYQLYNHARAEELGQEQLLQFQYGEVYTRMDALILQARVLGINLVLTCYLKEKYLKNEATGELVPDGPSHTVGLADVILNMRKETKVFSATKRQTTFYAIIEDNRYDPDMDGLELTNPTYGDLISVLGVA